MPVVVLLALPLIGCFVAGVLSRLLVTPQLSPAVAPRPAWPGNVVSLDQACRRRELGERLDWT